MQLSKKQNEYIVNATHRWNIKSGAVRSGKSYVDTAFVVPFRINVGLVNRDSMLFLVYPKNRLSEMCCSQCARFIQTS